MAAVFYKLVQDTLKPTQLTPESIFLNLRNHKCKIYDRVVIPQEAFRKLTIHTMLSKFVALWKLIANLWFEKLPGN